MKYYNLARNSCLHSDFCCFFHHCRFTSSHRSKMRFKITNGSGTQIESMFLFRRFLGLVIRFLGLVLRFLGLVVRFLGLVVRFLGLVIRFLGLVVRFLGLVVRFLGLVIRFLGLVIRLMKSKILHQFTTSTALKIFHGRREPNPKSWRFWGSDAFPDFNWVIFRFHVTFPGCSDFEEFLKFSFVFQTNPDSLKDIFRYFR